MPSTPGRSAGFTLVELMIVVVIIAIVSMFAVPSYNGYVADARRADAQGALIAFGGAMERHFANNASYLLAAGPAPPGVSTSTGTPWIFSGVAPLDGSVAYYNLTINAATQTTFTLHAAPTGAQTGDKCGTLTLAHTGTRGISGADAGVTVADCWR